MAGQWRAVILGHPDAYLQHRADVFRWVFLTPNLELCLPLQVGVVGPEAMVADLRLAPGMDLQDMALEQHARRFYGTPVYSHLSYALIALAVIGLLLVRRDPADWVFMALLGGSLAFVATFFLISVACDYRYLYLLDLAAMVGLLYVALDPPRIRRRRGR
jgi:Na+-transporting NADH:ubiquinone oxidoreductase subunit NqrB